MKRVKVRMQDLIVLLPGITGSVLQKDGRDLWSPSLRALFGAAATLGKNLNEMKLQGDDPEIDDLGDGITASRLVPDAVLVPGLVKIDGYTKLSEMIKACFDVKEGALHAVENTPRPANYFEFPYDWRRDNRAAARWLKQLIDARLPRWREYAGAEAGVILIAHSMGGIIARHYLEVLGGREYCKALITLGTPYGGSLKALDFLANGCRKYFVDLSQTMATFTSVYQLLPIYKAVNSGDGCKKVIEVDISGVNREMACEALAFHRRIMDEVDSRSKGGDKEPYLILPVVGTYQPTLQSAELYQGELTVSEALPPDVDRLLWHGDGTVPYLSATPHELGKSLRNNFYAESHGSLQCNDFVLDFIYDQLHDSQIKRPSLRGGPRGARQRTAISLYVDDLYTAGEPIVIRARVLEEGEELSDMSKFRKHMGAIRASLESVDRPGAKMEAELTRAGNEWRLECGVLQAGAYRAEVRTVKAGPLAPSPVHELFQVAAAV
jgi:pimeloyl-ACP methyl ester carboxylesterase